MNGASSSSVSCSSPSSLQLHQPLLSSEHPSHFSFSYHTHPSPSHFPVQQHAAFNPHAAVCLSPSSLSPTSVSSAFSPPPHHANIVFPPYPAHSLFPSTLPLSSSSSSLAALASAPCAPSGSWLKAPSASCTLIAALLCFSLLIAASLVSVLHVGSSSPTLLAALSRFRPHFGQASHLMAAQGAAAAGMGQTPSACTRRRTAR